MLNIITTYCLIGLVGTAFWAPLLISLLYRFDIVMKLKLMSNKMNAEFMKIHGHKIGTPTMGGLMISVTVGVLVVILLPSDDLRSIFLIGWGLFTLYGLADGLLVHARKLSNRFKILEASFEWRLGKLAVLYLIALVMLLLTTNYLAIHSIRVWNGFSIEVNPLTLMIGAFTMVLATYGMEITDGLDGLVTGLFLIALSGYLVIAFFTGQNELFPYISLIMGSSLVYLYFNISPARVFMGGTGTFPIGFALLYFALLTNTVAIFVVMGVVFWVELISSMIQIVSLRFFHRKVFKIAPIHHNFEAIGWTETKVVQRFWLAATVACVVALWLFSVVTA